LEEEEIDCLFEGQCLSALHKKDFDPKIDCKACRHNIEYKKMFTDKIDLTPIVENKIINE